MFIHYIHLLYLSYMCRCHIHHHQGELLYPLLNVTCSYVAITKCGYSSYVVNYKKKKKYTRIGILQNTSKVLDVAYWHFLLN